MRKVVFVLVMLCMMFSVLIPLQIFAQDSEELEVIIKSVKEKIDVP